MMRSLSGRLALSLGLGLAVLWLAAAMVTAIMLRAEVDEVFDDGLREAAGRLLPLAVSDIIERDGESLSQRLAPPGAGKEELSYVVRDPDGRVLLQSHGARIEDFLPYEGTGFQQTESHRFYNAGALQGTIRLTVAEPLARRAAIARQVLAGLALPLLFVLPALLLAIWLAVRFSLAPLHRFRAMLSARGPRDLSHVPDAGLPAEITPMAGALNDLLARLESAFEAERSFAANAAHELRTPLAGAIAQAQRLCAESSDENTRIRAAGIETTLKRLTRLSERLMQLARAEGGRLRCDEAMDLRVIARMVADETGAGRVRFALPPQPVLSDLDPDAFAILCRNLIENALRHGAPKTPIDVTLDQDGRFCVANAGPVVPPEKLIRLAQRFERADAANEGSGLGLAIIAAICDRIDSPLNLSSPRPGQEGGFEACIHLPVVQATRD